MRKLLLSSTAIASAAVLTANIAVADIAITAGTEWTYVSQSSQVTANDGTSFGTDAEIKFNFTNKTDTGLTVGYVVELESDDGNSLINESSISIAGGFGKVVLGGNDGVLDNYGFEAEDAVSEHSKSAHTSATIDLESGPTGQYNDANKVAYHLPAMGGLTVGAAFSDSGNTAGTDTTGFGFAYTMEAAGNTVTLAGGTETTEAATTDTDLQNLSAKVQSGNLTFIVSNSTYEAVDEDRSTTGAGVNYKMANGMVLGAYTFKSEDDLDAGEEYSKSGVEVMYTIAAGLKAIVNVDDYNYKIGTDNDGASTVADSGTISKLTIQASF